MNLTCLECKNKIDLQDYTNIEEGQVIECNMCGITLMVTNTGVDGKGEVGVEIVDEGK